MTGEQEPPTQDVLDLDALPPTSPAHRRFQPLGAAILGPSILWRDRVPGSAREGHGERTEPDTEVIAASLISAACADLPPDATPEQRHQAVHQLLESVGEEVETLLWPDPDQRPLIIGEQESVAPVELFAPTDPTGNAGRSVTL